MRKSLILRLVDITLLLLLSLMAAASIEPFGVDPPVSHNLRDRGSLAGPLRIEINSQGHYLVDGLDSLDVDELRHLLSANWASLLFIADAHAPASRLMDAHSVARAAGRHAAFVVRHTKPNQP